MGRTQTVSATKKTVMNFNKFSTPILTINTSESSQHIVRLWGLHLSEEAGKEKGKKKKLQQKEKNKSKK